MKEKESVELKNKTEGELNKLLSAKREELKQLRFDLAAGKVKNVKRIHELKKDIARILTRIHHIKEKGK